MNQLPVETLVNICAYLERDSDRDSLVSFSLSDKRSHQASKTILFRGIRIGLIAGEVQGKCQRWKDFLMRDAKCVQHVRSIKFFALKPFEPSISSRRDDPIVYVGSLVRRSDGMLADKHCDPESRNVLNDDENNALVDFVAVLSGLRHLTWDCPWQPIPSPLLSLITRMDCRLSLPSFRLHSLLRRSAQSLEFNGPIQSVDIDAYDFKLATSPCLESLALRGRSYEEGFENYNFDAVLDMISGAAPNLRNVTLEFDGFFFPSTQGHTGEERALRTRIPRQPWRDDLLLPTSSTLPGALRCLKFPRGPGMGILVSLSARMDFSLLQVLDLAASIKVLCWLTDRLSSLHTLRIKLSDPSPDSSKLQAAAQSFFLSIPPLPHLALKGRWTAHTLEVVLQYHGPALRELLLDSGVLHFPNYAESIQRYCPSLEDLNIPFQRTQGDASEVSAARTPLVLSGAALRW